VGVAVTGERVARTTPSLADRVPGWNVIIQLALWSFAVGDLLYWADLGPSDLILQPLQTIRTIVRGIADEAGTMLLFLFYGAAVVVPVWFLRSFAGRSGLMSNACSPAKSQPTLGTPA
jgi:hypothetical protein